MSRYFSAWVQLVWSKEIWTSWFFYIFYFFFALELAQKKNYEDALFYIQKFFIGMFLIAVWFSTMAVVLALLKMKFKIKT
jgi:hypothetical protein